MPDNPPLPGRTSTPGEDNQDLPSRRHQRPARPSRGKWIAAGTAAVLLAAAGISIPLLLNDSAAPALVEPETTAVAEETPLPPEPAFAYYSQIGPPEGSPLTAVEPLALTVGETTTGTSLPAGLVGLSLEATDLADPAMSGDNAEMVQSLSGLGNPLLRFGGNAVDRRFFWTSANEPVPGNLTGDKAHPVRAVTPADLERVNTLLVALDATINLTVDLGNYDPARAADMTAHASRIFGERLVGVTVGNEPNGYAGNGLREPDWTVEDYLTELKAYAQAMYDAAPDVKIVGPGVYSQSWWEPFAKVELPQEKIFSFHHYPLSSCDAAKDPGGAPVLANLMSQNIHDHADRYRGAALDPANAAGLETWITETGVSACPGSNETTKTHASALWAADYAISGAQLGVSRLSFHSSLITCTGGPPMSAICTGGQYLQPDGTVDERANFFGLSMIAEMQPGDFLKVEEAGGGISHSYAVHHADGSISVVLVNANNPETDAQMSVSLKLPARPLTAAMTQLTGSSFASEDSTLIDGQRAEAVPVSERLTLPGFAYGSETQEFVLTAGTVTILNFTFQD
ncbi:hypothetical protein [Arthrobacter sp. Helios]|uniref:hypothetical protein n=1 Tax=Arthrobacter sp. Helios TaxID=2828862 RepID=UPI002048E1FD|nr:hypothetical protein [Arthrobacter sp. Helios]UPO78632.1 hypothetical protein ArtHe_08240 [Arthrobacter sp. Helios]